MSYAQIQQGAADHGLFARLKADLYDRLARRRVYRTTLNELSALSNRELADLGLTRSMLRGVAWQAAYGD